MTVITNVWTEFCPGRISNKYYVVLVLATNQVWFSPQAVCRGHTYSELRMGRPTTLIGIPEQYLSLRAFRSGIVDVGTAIWSK